MKTSSSDIAETEKFLRGKMNAEDSLVFQARLLLDEELKRSTLLHRMVHRLVKIYHRKKIKIEVEVVHERLFSQPETGFSERMMKIFTD